MSQTPHKPLQKMCKSPKNTSYQPVKQDKIDYENLSTNCTVVGSNNLNLVKKPQMITNMAPSPAYSNPSPGGAGGGGGGGGYPPSPYSSPVSMKSPSPSLKPPTPQPPSFPVMQIIHNNLLTTRPMQTTAQQQQNIIKLKPHLNILPKPSASPQPSPKPSVSPQIVIPTTPQQAAAIMPAAQPLLLNQMPMLTAPGVQFILRPQTSTKIQPQVQTATATPQGLILQPGGQQLLQIQPPRSQPMVRVLTNGVQLAPTSTTYVTTQVGSQQQPLSATHIAQQQAIVNNSQHQQQVIQQHQHQQHHQLQQQIKKKPKHKVKKKLDLANIMKLSGIGDEDDIQFESDTSQSESEPTSVPTTPQPQQQQPQQVLQGGTVQAQSNFVQQTTDAKKNIQNIQISAMTAQPTINAATPVVQVLNQNFQSASQAAAAQAGIPFNSFITPNFTINNGLMLQRSGGFKLTMGEDGRLVLQHDPTLNQDLQSQIILQSLLGLNGGLVLQPSMDQQTVQQTVQTIQQQSVQTIQQQTVQSQTIQTVQQQTVQPQTVQHAIQSLQPQIQQQTVQQTIQHQTVNALQQPMQIVQPQPIQSVHTQGVQPMHSIAQSQVHSLQSQIQGQIQSLLQQQQQQQQNHHHHTVQPHTLANMQQNAAVQQQNVQQQSIQHHPQPVPSPVHTVQQQTYTSQQQSFNSQQQTHTPTLKVQPFQKTQPPVQTVQPIQHHSISQQQQQQHSANESQPSPNNTNMCNPPPASFVVNLTPDQLEQLKRNGQLTVNGQTIFMQRPTKDQCDKKLSPKSKPVKKVNKIQNMKNILHDVNDSVKMNSNSCSEQTKESTVILTSTKQPPPMVKQHVLPQNHVQPQPQVVHTKPVQPQAMVQPSIQIPSKIPPERTKPMGITPQIPKQQKVAPTVMSHQSQDSNGSNTNSDVDRLLGQILEESGGIGGPNLNVAHSTTAPKSTLPSQPPQQRITTIQLTPQKQQHLKSIQLQIQSLSARLTPGDTDVQNTLKLLFAEQQKILASGKLLSPDKVYYHNNQLTIVNPSNMNLSPTSPAPPVQVKNEPPPSPSSSSSNVPQNTVRCTSVESQTNNSHQPLITTQPQSQQPPPPAPPPPIPRISVSVPPTSETIATQTIHHHPTPPHPPPPSHPPPHSPHLPPHLPAHPHHPAIGHAHPVANGNHPTVVVSTAGQQQHAQTPPQLAQQQLHQAKLHHQQQQQQQQQSQQQQQQLLQQQQQQQQLALAKRAHLIETQLNLDQSGAVKPDIHTPFRDKKDACIRLIRYHCLEQPVLSEKDLDKADEIFELTARHFIAKYAKMVDKYKYLLMKESMRHVQTSELMMIDRMFLAEEQQSILRLRQDYENEIIAAASAVSQPNQMATDPSPPSCSMPPPASPAPAQANQTAAASQGGSGASEPVPEDYDEWACIQRELGCLPQPQQQQQQSQQTQQHQQQQESAASTNKPQQHHPHHIPKRSASSDSRLETLKRFRVDKHHKRPMDCAGDVSQGGGPHYTEDDGGGQKDDKPENSIDEQVQSAIDSILNLQQNTTASAAAAAALDLDSILS